MKSRPVIGLPEEFMALLERREEVRVSLRLPLVPDDAGA